MAVDILELAHQCKPTFVVDWVYSLNFIELAINGPVNVILDVDNTVVAANEDEVPPHIIQHINWHKERGYIREICLLSNIGVRSAKRERRVDDIATAFGGVPYITACLRPKFWPRSPKYPQLKPDPEGFLAAMVEMHSTFDNTVVVDDQLLTGILGGNRLGLRTVWIRNRLGPDNPLTFFKRQKEKRIIEILRL